SSLMPSKLGFSGGGGRFGAASGSTAAASMSSRNRNNFCMASRDAGFWSTTFDIFQSGPSCRSESISTERESYALIAISSYIFVKVVIVVTDVHLEAYRLRQFYRHIFGIVQHRLFVRN